MVNNDIFLFFLSLDSNVQLYHWNTKSYARHKGSDELLNNLRENIDKFIEVYIGHHGRPSIKHEKINIRYMSDTDFVEYIHKCHEYVSLIRLKDETDLINIRDEIIANLFQALYLFTLN